MIVGTAGQIDRGKTRLVKALTGVDTDRLPKEKKRGISIEPGYAFLDAPDGADRVAPGHAALVQLVRRDKIGAWRGDPVVLRDASAARTVAGGPVLDPNAPARYRRTPQRLAQPDAWQRPAITERLVGLLASAANGLNLAAWQRAEGVLGLPTLPLDTLCAGAGGEVMAIAGGSAGAAALATTPAVAACSLACVRRGGCRSRA